MKTVNIIIACCLGVMFGYAQNYNESNVILEQERLLYTDFLKSTLNSKKDLSNVVFITQQGKNNVSNIKVKAQKSDVKVRQKGDENKVEIDVYAKYIDEDVTQIGSGNIFKDYNHFNKQLHKIKVHQEGDNQRIYVSGTNSISKELKIIQKGNDKTIFINNF